MNFVTRRLAEAVSSTYKPGDKQCQLLSDILLLGRVSYSLTADSCLQLAAGQNGSLIYTPGCNNTQQKAIQHALTAREGIACIQGPPATGKTQTVAWMIANAATMLDPRCGMIVGAAETNEAVYVLAERYLEKALLCDDREKVMRKIVIVDSDNKKQFSRLSGILPPVKVRPLLLHSHMEAIAKADKNRYQDWIDGDEELKKKGSHQRQPHILSQ